MSTCSKEAGDKKLAGDERKKFMSDCLKGDHADHSAATGSDEHLTAQQDKMAGCKKEAGDRKGDDRKKFISACMKG